MKEDTKKLYEIKDKIKRGTAIFAASAMLTTPGMLKVKGFFNKNEENPYSSPAYCDIELPKSVLKSVAEYLGKSAPDINRLDILEIKNLVVEDNGINNLDFVINFTNLETLTISGMHITDISALKYLKLKNLIINYTSINNEDLKNLPNSLEELTICDCPFISDCSILPNIVPKLKLLELNCLASLRSLEFIKDMNISSFYVNQLGIVDNNLLEYLLLNNINNNITQEDLDYCTKLDNIINSIIYNGMSEKEKIQAVTLYVIKNIEFELSRKRESNIYPLSTALEGSGVCTAYSYLMSSLLSKLDMESYQICNDTHAWTLIQKDNKYYYIDSTNLTQNFSFLEDLFEKYGIGLYYMQDPNSSIFSYMDRASGGNVALDDEMFNKILRGEKNKNLVEKYFSNGYLDIVYIAALFTAINVLSAYSYKKQKRKKLDNR